MRALIASPLGFVIGLSLGALGGGGSILAVPALVYAAGQTPKQATTSSLVLVMITSAAGMWPHWKAGRIRPGAGAMFGLAGVGGSLLGSSWNAGANPDVLLLAFSGVMLVAAAAMLRRARQAASGVGSATDGTPAAVNRARPRRVDPITVVKVVVAGSFVGLLTGFFGVGGGFVIVPALVLALGFTMPEAIGTSLLVIAINSVVALTTRLHGGDLHWATVIPFLVASLAGMATGTRLAATHQPAALQRWFVGLLVMVSLYTAAQSIAALV